MSGIFPIRRAELMCEKKSLRKGNNTIYNNSVEKLQDAIGSLILDDISVSPHRDDEQVLLVSLQRLHRTLFRAERFKAWVAAPHRMNGP